MTPASPVETSSSVSSVIDRETAAQTALTRDHRNMRADAVGEGRTADGPVQTSH
jgi:hypothetical protein